MQQDKCLPSDRRWDILCLSPCCSRTTSESFECRSEGWWKSCGKKIYHGRIQVTYSAARSPTLESVQKKNQLEAARRAGTVPSARWDGWPSSGNSGRRRDLQGVSGTFWVSRMRTNSEPRRSSHLWLKPSYAAAVALNCQTRDSASRLRPRRLTSLPSVIQRSRLPGNDSGLWARRRCGERTQRFFFQGRPSDGAALLAHADDACCWTWNTHTVTHQTHAIWFDCQVLKDHYSHLATHRIRR